jgi:hypothetical protein
MALRSLEQMRLGLESGGLRARGGTGSLSYDPKAAQRVRQLLAGRDDAVEKRMVGGMSFLIDGNMCCGITGTALMVRVGAEGRDQALREPHVRPMQFTGRDLAGFICVEPAGFAADNALTGCSGDSISFRGFQRNPPARADDDASPHR